ncbi:adenine phosphoribosyltransferase [bacterium]|nr:adenine phosphoribosyltransferase [bacterium]
MSDGIKKVIRNIADFPIKGVLYRDITPLLLSPDIFSEVCDKIYDRYSGWEIDKIAAIESRGFIFASVLAYKLKIGLILIRKEGKLPSKKINKSYSLEYAKESLEMHVDSIKEGDRVLIIDDLLATGGTVEASCKMIEELGGKVEELCFLIELTGLNGRKRLDGKSVFSLVSY